MLHFCTLFDANYLSRGLVTYESLMSATNGTAHLYVFAFDDKCLEILTNMKLKNLTIISLSDFEDKDLLAIKPTRSQGEYCWTCTSSTILYCLKTYKIPHCIYIDADMYFYQNPQVLVDEMSEKDNVLITEHRYTPQYDKSKLSGTYCVQFMLFKNTEGGLKVLNWWRDRCLDWCFNRHEDGKFGDQKYLDDWTTRFEGIHVLNNLGGGLAPWNVQQYEFKQQDGEIVGMVKDTFNRLYFNERFFHHLGIMEFLPIFFHFHGVKLYENGAAIYAPRMYILSKTVRQFFYESYLQKLQLAQEQLMSFDPDMEKRGYLTSRQYLEDKKKGWGAFVKTNVFNKIFTSLNPLK
jgi:hypothetical protein